MGSLDVSHLGFEAAREAARLKAVALAKAAAESKESPEREFEPKETSLSEPKEGQHDDKEHSGGNKWAGGVRIFCGLILLLCPYSGHFFFRLEEETLLGWAAGVDISDIIKEGRSNRFVWLFFLSHLL